MHNSFITFILELDLSIQSPLLRQFLLTSGYPADAIRVLLPRFPKQEDFVPPPPIDETSLEKMERISLAVKVFLIIFQCLMP